MSQLSLHPTYRVLQVGKALLSFAISGVLFSERSPSNGEISLLFPVLALFVGIFLLGSAARGQKADESVA